MLAEYFSFKPLYLDVAYKTNPNIRKIDEEPWQWTQLENFNKLKDNLTNLDFLYLVLKNNEPDAFLYWNILRHHFDMPNEILAIVKNGYHQGTSDEISRNLYAASALLQIVGSHDSAIETLQSVLNFDLQAFGKESPNVARDMSSLGLELLRRGKAAEAETILIKAIGLFQTLKSANELDLATALNNLALCYSYQGKTDYAKRYYQESLNIIKNSPYSETATEAMILFNSVVFDTKFEAVKKLRHALKLVENIYGKSHSKTALYLNELAKSLLDSRPYEALNLAKRALEINEMIYGKNTIQCVDSMFIIAMFYYQGNKFSDAEMLLRQALEISQNSDITRKEIIALLFEKLGMVILNLDKRNEAKKLLNEALAFWKTDSRYTKFAEQVNQAMKLNNL